MRRFASLGFGVLVLAVCVLAGCTKASYVPPSPVSVPPKAETVVPKPFDQTWTTLVDYVSASFYAIDAFEKDSGLMTLSFSASDPSPYIDCGHFSMESQSLVGTQSVDTGYATYLSAYGASLSGKVNIFIRAVSDSSTSVRVSVRYVLSSNSAPPWVFDTGGQATVTVPTPAEGTSPYRTCRPTHAIESAILSAVAK